MGAERSPVEDRTTVIAVVEDNAGMLRSIGRLLTIEGYNVEAYESAEAFLDRRSANQVSCLILDVQLPKMSGIELVQRLVESSALPIIFITAIEDDSVRAAAFQLGCVAYLRKPFQPEALVAAVQHAVGEPGATFT
jgi:FixJ family two-component response regulator